MNTIEHKYIVNSGEARGVAGFSFARGLRRAGVAGLLLWCGGVALQAAGPSTQPAKGPATAPAVDYYAISAEDFFNLPVVRKRITQDSADLPLAEAAIYHQTNLELAKLGKPRMGHSKALQETAHDHSVEMAAMNYFSHNSPVDTRKTPFDRMIAVGVESYSENIHVRQAMDLPSGTMRTHVDPFGNVTKFDAKTGQPADYYTYKEMARAALEAWMNSPGHRRTILDPTLKFLGTGVGRGPIGEDKQDSLYFTQDFASRVPDGQKVVEPAATAPATSAPTPAPTTAPATRPASGTMRFVPG